MGSCLRESTSSIMSSGKNISYSQNCFYLFCASHIEILFLNTILIQYILFYRENEFEDGNHFYRFLEHEPFIPRCFNFRGIPNDSEPKPAALVSQRITKIMSAVLESYASEDRRHLDYVGISNSEEFRRYLTHYL